MINTQYLEEKIKQSGKKKEYLARKCGITRQSLSSKIRNDSQFTVDQVAVLCKELDITRAAEKESIFFAPRLKETETKEGGKHDSA